MTEYNVNERDEERRNHELPGGYAAESGSSEVFEEPGFEIPRD